MDTGEGPTISQKVRFFLLYFIHCRNMLNAEKVSFFNRKRGGESSPSGDMLIKISEAPDCNQSGTSFSEEIFPLYNKSPKVTLLVALRNLAPPKSTQHTKGLEVNPPPSCLFLFIVLRSLYLPNCPGQFPGHHVLHTQNTPPFFSSIPGYQIKNIPHFGANLWKIPVCQQNP